MGLFSVLLRPRAIAITTAAPARVLLIGQWINLGDCEGSTPMSRALLLMLWGWTVV